MTLTAACGGGGSTKALDDSTERACACERDTSCGKKVLAELQTYPDHNGRPAYSEHLTKTGLRLQECLSVAGVDPPLVVSALDKVVK